MKASLVVLLFLHISCIYVTSSDVNYDDGLEYLIHEPQGYFSKIDNENLLENSKWNSKDYAIDKKSYVPEMEEEEVYNNEEDENITVENPEEEEEEDDGGEEENNENNEKRENVAEAYDNDENSDSDSDVTEDDSDPNDAIESDESGSGSGSGNDEDLSFKRDDLAMNLDDVEEETESGSGDSDTSDLYDNNDEQSSDSDESGASETSDAESGSTDDNVELSTFNEQKNEPKTKYSAEIIKKNAIPLPPVKRSHISGKRQYISRPRFVVRNGYVYMKAPPMTQKTIVTTHIPRPPMVMPYNTFLHRYRGGGGYGMGRRMPHYMLPQQQLIDASDDGFDGDDRNDDERSKCDVNIYALHTVVFLSHIVSHIHRVFL